MTTPIEPNPPSRRHEDFPKTTTVPEGWMTDDIMAAYNPEGSVYDPGEPARADTRPIPVPTTGKVNGKQQDASHNGRSHETAPAQPQHSQRAAFDGESPFSRQLNPFPSDQDLTGTYL